MYNESYFNKLKVSYLFLSDSCCCQHHYHCRNGRRFAFSYQNAFSPARSLRNLINQLPVASCQCRAFSKGQAGFVFSFHPRPCRGPLKHTYRGAYNWGGCGQREGSAIMDYYQPQHRDAGYTEESLHGSTPYDLQSRFAPRNTPFNSRTEQFLSQRKLKRISTLVRHVW